ncbi:host attachment protein [Sulfuricurvum sp.]|uniref:host attachment protein n=1 Tax=Sulfuricurvum sp. TaxID=2025608 RepID=UPI00356358E5
MSSTLIIVADLQRFKLFSPKKDPVGRESVGLIESIDTLDFHQRLNEKVSDQQGHFRGVGAGQGVIGSGSGEDHNIELEEEHRRIKEIAAQISSALQNHPHENWYFAAPKAINNQIVELLNSAAKSSMTVNLHSDLTNTPDDQLLKHFTK